MASPEERERHRKRMKRKIRDKVKRVQSPIAKELITSNKYGQRIVKDKRGRAHDLATLSSGDLVRLIQELDE